MELLEARFYRFPSLFSLSCRHILLALVHCHQHGLLHRDVKPENILLVDKPKRELLTSSTPLPSAPFHLKLADFGLAVRLRPGQQAVGMHGSTVYMAPEVVCRQPYGLQADLWGVGVILFTALSGGCACGRQPTWWKPSSGSKRVVLDRVSLVALYEQKSTSEAQHSMDTTQRKHSRAETWHSRRTVLRLESSRWTTVPVCGVLSRMDCSALILASVTL